MATLNEKLNNLLDKRAKKILEREKIDNSIKDLDLKIKNTEKEIEEKDMREFMRIAKEKGFTTSQLKDELSALVSKSEIAATQNVDNNNE